MPESVKGFRDLLPEESERFHRLEETARRLFRIYGFREVRLPTLEFEELFRKSTGETTDIVEKEMFTLQDAGGRKLALRPEGTPGVVRAYLEHSLHQKGKLAKLFYIGSMFRAERPQKGRFREFEQIGVEYLGNPDPSADAEVILLLRDIYDSTGLREKYEILLNNLGCERPDCRPAYRKRVLEFLESNIENLCENCQRRIHRNPLRAFDCKIDAEKMQDKVLVMNPCAECLDHMESVATLLAASGCKNPLLVPNLVRGLDYYNRTVFEFKAKGIGAQDAIAGGGRYDTLVQAMGGPATPAVGWAMGVDRTLLATQDAQLQSTQAERGVTLFSVTTEDSDKVRNWAFETLGRMRTPPPDLGLSVTATSGCYGDSMKSQMRQAEGADFIVITGPSEAGTQSVTVKRLGRQETLKWEDFWAWIIRASADAKAKV